ncbi:Insulin-like protein [Euroglyphus maynei]|uniref:Insulin-like protein n=1 Tax=Euroglyphus maynei TaxID=6958 RepID=A0A1Y3B0Y6_EURMA|nr:Insulin-like protein [Euroglyphus maynei]
MSPIETYRKSKLLSIITIIIIGRLCHLINVNNSDNYGVMATTTNENIVSRNVETLYPSLYSSSDSSTDMMSFKSNNDNNIDNYESIDPLLQAVSSPSSSLLSTPIKIETRGSEKHHYCGENLIKALALYCKGYYATKRTSGTLMNEDCRNEPYNNNNENQIDANQLSNTNDKLINFNELTWPDIMNILKYSHYHDQAQPQPQQQQQSSSYRNQGYLSEWLLDSYLRTHNNNNNHQNRIQRPKRGIVDECCKRPCGLKTLNQYCGIRKRPTY